jgi:hypothetical protein
VAAHLQAGLGAARLAGAAEGVRQRMGMPIPERDAAMVERFLAPARAAIARDMWEAELTAGRARASSKQPRCSYSKPQLTHPHNSAQNGPSRETSAHRRGPQHH